MTVSSETNRWDYTGNGALQTYPFTAEIYAKTDLLVYVSGALKTVDVDYTIDAASIDNPAGGNVVFTTAPLLSAPIAIVLNLPMTQLIDYVEGDKFPAETHERALDRLVKLIQYLKSKFSHVAKLGDDSAIELVMPNPVADNFIGWNAAATNLENKANPVVLTTATQWEVDALVTYGGGTAYTKATIDTALTAIGTVNKTTLLLRPGNWTITASADYSSYTNVTFKMPNGSYFTITALMTLTLPSPSNIIASPNQQIFSGAGTVSFSKPGTIYPYWWTTNTTPGTTDMTSAILAAHGSLSSGGVISLLDNCLVSAQIPITNSGITIQGNGTGGIKLKDASAVSAGSNWLWIKVQGNDCLLDRLTIDANGLAQTNLFNAVSFGNMASGSALRGIIQNCVVKNAYGTGILAARSDGTKIICNHIEDSTGAAGNPGEGIVTTEASNVEIIGNNIIDVSDTSIYLANNSTNILIVGNVFYDATNQHINIYGDVLGVTISGNILDTSAYGVYVYNNGADYPNNVVVSGNTFKNISTLSIQTDFTAHPTGAVLVVSGNIGAGDLSSSWITFTDADTTPNVSGGNYFIAANTVGTTITNFEGVNASDGKEITIYFTNGNTTIDRTNAYLAGGANFTGTANDMITLIYRQGVGWIEKCRSVNS